MELLPEIEKRYSVRSFSNEMPDPAAIERILEAGRRAPSAKNRQSWRFIVIKRPSVHAKIVEAAYGEDHVAQAPVVISLCTTNIDYKMPNGQLSYPIDLSIAASFMMLQAVHENLGTCMITTFNEESVREVITVPYSMRVVMLLLVGIPADKQPFPNRLPLERVSSYDHW